MPYTLVKWLLWLLLAGLVGGVVGWLLRGIRCRSEVAAARATTVDADDVLAMRRRLANLELTVVERNQFKAERDELRQAMKQRAAAPAEVAEVAEVAASAEVAEVSGVAGIAGIAGIAGTDDAPASAEPEAPGAPAEPAAPVAPVLDDAALARAAEVLGRPVKLDDLTVVEGIGPKIAELLQGAGITTWWGLATGGVDPVQAALTAAGPRYQVHDPGTWPQQADLLAHGRWEEFQALTDALDGGRQV